MPKTFEALRGNLGGKVREIARTFKRRIYNSAQWQRLAKVVLAEEPICYVCHEAPATQVDHKEPLDDRPELAFVRENLGGICAKCHGLKTRQEDRKGGVPCA